MPSTRLLWLPGGPALPRHGDPEARRDPVDRRICVWLQLPHPSSSLLLSAQHLVGLGPRPAARSCCSSLPRCQPAATPVSHRPPPTTLFSVFSTSAPTCGSTAPPPPLPSQPKSKSKSRLWGGASPWRAPRCACTLAVTCQPGEQRFRCVRGVRAHPRAPVTCHHCATMPNWCYIPLLLFQPSLIFR